MNFSDRKLVPVRFEKALYLLALSAFIVAYLPVLDQLIRHWISSDDQSYGIFIVPFSVYLLLKNKKQWIDIPKRTSIAGAVTFTLSIATYLFAQIAEIDTLSSLSLVFTIYGAVWYLFGITFVRALSFPLGLLLLMIPIPTQLYSLATVPLQLFVSKVSTELAQLIGLPVYREGNIIILPNYTLAVVQACSGLRSLMALITLCTVYGYLTLKRNRLRIIMVISALPVALLANILRVFIMVIAFHYFDYDLAHDTAHTVFGVLIFIFALVLVVALRRVLSPWDREKAAI
jgi:exosortase